MSIHLVSVAPASVAAELRHCVLHVQQMFADRSITPEIFNEVRANEQLLFAGSPQVGSDGLLVERSTGKIWDIPGAIGRAYLWAYLRGFRIEDDNVVVIEVVRDRDATLAVLKRGLRAPAVNDEIAPRLTAPLALQLPWDSLWVMLRALEAADLASGPFTFSVNPTVAP